MSSQHAPRDQQVTGCFDIVRRGNLPSIKVPMVNQPESFRAPTGSDQFPWVITAPPIITQPAPMFPQQVQQVPLWTPPVIHVPLPQPLPLYVQPLTFSADMYVDLPEFTRRIGIQFEMGAKKTKAFKFVYKMWEMSVKELSPDDKVEHVRAAFCYIMSACCKFGFIGKKVRDACGNELMEKVKELKMEGVGPELKKIADKYPHIKRYLPIHIFDHF